MISGSIYSAGLNNVGNYQVAGIPYVTSSTISDGGEAQIGFPWVTNNVTIKNDTPPIAETTASLSCPGVGGPRIYYYTDGTTEASRTTVKNVWFSGSAVGQKTGFTISLWIKWLGPFGTNKRTCIAGFKSQDTYDIGNNLMRTHYWADAGYPGRVITRVYNVANVSSPSAGDTGVNNLVVKNTWTHVAWVFEQTKTADGGKATSYSYSSPTAGDLANTGSYSVASRFYKNGAFHSQWALPDTACIDLQGLSVGNFSYGYPIIGTKWYNGIMNSDIRDLVHWNGILTADQIEDLYDANNCYTAPAWHPTASLGDNSPESGFALNQEIVKWTWIKPTGSIGTVAYVAKNHGTPTYKMGDNMLTNDATPTDNGSIIASSPYTGSCISPGGTVQFALKSTGSYPNVINKKHYWKLENQNDKLTMNIKTKEIYLSAVRASADGGECTYSIQADLTTIPTERMFALTGSGIDS